MITGATLIDYREKYSLKEYFKRRISKTVIPFLFWSVVGMLFVVRIKHLDMPSIPQMINGILNTRFITIYWFFKTLFAIYLSIPLFAAVERNARKEVFTYLAIAGFIFNYVVPFITTHIFTDYSVPISVEVVSEALLYVVVGYLLNNYELQRKTCYAIYALAVLAFFIHCYGTYVASTAAGEVQRTWKGYYSAQGAVYSVGVFVWLKNNSAAIMSNKVVNTIIKAIAPYTFGVYLLQYFIYMTMRRVFAIDTTSIVYRLGAPFIVIPVAMAIVWLFRKIPVLKHVVP